MACVSSIDLGSGLMPGNRNSAGFALGTPARFGDSGTQVARSGPLLTRSLHGSQDAEGAAAAVAGARDGRREDLRDCPEMRPERRPQGRMGKVPPGNGKARAGLT